MSTRDHYGSAQWDVRASHQRFRSASAAMIYASLSFGMVSVIAYSIWAFRLIPGEAALYTATAFIYMGMAGIALSRVVITPGGWKKFSLLFAIGFLLYAVLWCACWFSLRGKFHADLWGAAAGLIAMTWWFRRVFRSSNAFLPLFAVLFTFHSLGYYLGDVLHGAFSGTVGRLLWGAAHGMGFGAGLGYVLFFCQPRTNNK